MSEPNSIPIEFDGIDPFRRAFAGLTGRGPFPWQEALYKKFAAGVIPTTLSLPTGLGKTSVVVIWLIALAHAPDKTPRRLVYVVNRRTVVDQTTDEVELWRSRLKNENGLKPIQGIVGSLAISTLRGQFADNRE